ncbi:hypothetical protein K501DRAFT_335718 [Backusella circina FSU 941]|nr:hypothetical protein K501DRAFT_335718 [Backusella circina FSU 941]
MSRIDLDKVTIEELCKVFEEDGVKVSKSMATKAKKGQSIALSNIANKYTSKHEYEKAFEWNLLAANNGNIDALLNVGHHYYRGEGVKQDYLNALEWYLKYTSLSRNTTSVLSLITGIFENGLGVPVNKVKAHEWNLCNENQTYSFMLGVAADLPKERKGLDVMIAESQEIVRVEKEKRAGNNGTNVLLGDPEPITIDSPSPSSSAQQQLNEQLQQYHQRQQTLQFQQKQLQPLQQHEQQHEHKRHESRNQPRIQGEIHHTNPSVILPQTSHKNSMSIDSHERKIQYLEDTNFHLIELLKQEKQEKGEMYNTMRSRIIGLEEENRDMKKKMEEAQQSNHNLTVLLEQERRIRKNDMELADQERKKIMKRS